MDGGYDEVDAPVPTTHRGMSASSDLHPRRWTCAAIARRQPAPADDEAERVTTGVAFRPASAIALVPIGLLAPRPAAA